MILPRTHTIYLKIGVEFEVNKISATCFPPIGLIKAPDHNRLSKKDYTLKFSIQQALLL